jgi:hypothetical protein
VQNAAGQQGPNPQKVQVQALDFGNIFAALPTYLCTYLYFGCPLSSISLFLPVCTCVGKKRHIRSEEMAPPQGLALGPQSSLLRPTGAKRSRTQTARWDGAEDPSGTGAHALREVAKATKASNAKDEEKDASRKEAGRRRKPVVTTFPGRSTGRKTPQKQAPKGKEEDEKKQQLEKEKGAKEEQKRLRAVESEKQKQLEKEREEREKQKRLQAKEDEKKQLEKKEAKEAKEFEEEKRLKAEEIEKDKLEKEKEAKKEEKKRLKAKEDELKKQRREEEKRLQQEAEQKRAKQEQKEDCLRKKKEKEEKEKMDKAAELERRQQVRWRG